ncbi:DsrE family protein [Palleronia pelagia]|uniref:Uncharacterized protein n=1 Tax=Palleronia pelagia TaxID=387096 RepID=A0A1H8LNB2_9RHOB|nr:DsrE family protein [Palleronia pelagia]SEO06589.1 hypothetical protein SAMN04488011_11120 [Palleronia pelagia]
MRGLLFGLAAALAVVLGGLTAGAQTSDRYGEQRVVYHVNFPGGEGNRAYKGSLRNLKNHMDAVGDANLGAVIVVHGNGIGLVQEANSDLDLQNQLLGLKSRGVEVRVCNNTLVGLDIDPVSLFEVYDEDIVPSGVAELSYLQQQGYTYIRTH